MLEVSQKILLVTETPPGSPNGFGVTLKCLFKNIDHDVVYTDAAFSEHGDLEGFTLAQVPYHRSIKHFLPFLRGRIPEWRSIYSKKWLKENLIANYTKVYAFVYSTGCLIYATWIARQRKLPLIVHCADHSSEFETPLISTILKNCYRMICITEDMRMKYESMLNRTDLEVLHNGAESECFDIQPPAQQMFCKDRPFILCFLGGLFSNLHGDCIEDVFQAVSKLKKQNVSIEFHLYGQLNPEDFLAKDLMSEGATHHGIVMPLCKKYEIMKNAHCFIIPSSFDPGINSHYRYSFPTKLPELLASGRPILSYGPKDTSTNRLLSKNNLGFRINERSIQEIQTTISTIINNYNTICQNITNKDKQISKNFSATKVRGRLQTLLNTD